MVINRSDVLRDPRLAGQVKRYHTWPVHQAQSVAEHTWQVLRLYLKVWGELPSHIAVYLLWHDGGELVTGDPPYPLKANNPKLKAAYDELEGAAVAAMGGVVPFLRKGEKQRVKFVDLLEMFEFGAVELKLGNQYAWPILTGTAESLRLLAESMPKNNRRAALEQVRKVDRILRELKACT